METIYRYVRIKPEDVSFFSFLDPYEKLRLLALPVGFAMGAIEDATAAPVGLLVASVSDESMIIEWMATDPGHRWRGIGEELLYRMFVLSRDAGVETLSAFSTPEFKKESMLRDADKYFRQRLFTRECPVGGDAEFTVGELRESPAVKNASGNPSGIIRLSELTGVKRRECINHLASIDNASYTFSPKMLASVIDEDVSVIVRSAGSLEGALLVCRAGDVLYPMYHYAKSNRISDAMIYQARNRAEEKYGSGCPVCFMMRQEGMGDLAAEVLGYVPEGTLLMADVSSL